jgi:hypothetical protein
VRGGHVARGGMGRGASLPPEPPPK